MVTTMYDVRAALNQIPFFKVLLIFHILTIFWYKHCMAHRKLSQSSNTRWLCWALPKWFNGDKMSCGVDIFSCVHCYTIMFGFCCLHRGKHGFGNLSFLHHTTSKAISGLNHLLRLFLWWFIYTFVMRKGHH